MWRLLWESGEGKQEGEREVGLCKAYVRHRLLQRRRKEGEREVGLCKAYVRHRLLQRRRKEGERESKARLSNADLPGTGGRVRLVIRGQPLARDHKASWVGGNSSLE